MKKTILLPLNFMVLLAVMMVCANENSKSENVNSVMTLLLTCPGWEGGDHTLF
jgi:hypothetical protein